MFESLLTATAWVLKENGFNLKNWIDFVLKVKKTGRKEKFRSHQIFNDRVCHKKINHSFRQKWIQILRCTPDVTKKRNYTVRWSGMWTWQFPICVHQKKTIHFLSKDLSYFWKQAKMRQVRNRFEIQKWTITRQGNFQRQERKFAGGWNSVGRLLKICNGGDSNDWRWRNTFSRKHEEVSESSSPENKNSWNSIGISSRVEVGMLKLVELLLVKTLLVFIKIRNEQQKGDECVCVCKRVGIKFIFDNRWHQQHRERAESEQEQTEFLNAFFW